MTTLILLAVFAAPLAALLFTLGGTLGTSLIQYVLVPAIPILGSALLWCLVHLALFIRGKANGNKVLLGLASVVDFVNNATKTVVDQLGPDVQADLANDGVIDANERAALMQKTMTLIKGLLPSWAQSLLTSQFGAGAEQWLMGQVSKALDQHLTAQMNPDTVTVGAAKPAPASSTATTPPSAPAPKPTVP